MVICVNGEDNELRTHKFPNMQCIAALAKGNVSYYESSDTRKQEDEVEKHFETRGGKRTL